MGCDIHSAVEVFTDGKWEWTGERPLGDRNYALFGWLADVRNYSAIEPLAQPRGIPEDCYIEDIEDYILGDHSFSWFLLSELLAVDYEAEVNDRRVTRQVGKNSWDGGCTGTPEEGEKLPLREFLGEEFFEALDIMKTLGPPEKVRLVFGFDS